jgi:Tol biopolymer transport system component
LVSQDNNTPPNPAIGQNFSPVISSDGLSVAFMSQATNLLAPAPSPTGQQIYLRSLQVGGQTSLVSQDNSGNPAAAVLTATPAITINGSFVAFVSTATNLVTSPPSAAPEDIFVRALP